MHANPLRPNILQDKLRGTRYAPSGRQGIDRLGDTVAIWDSVKHLKRVNDYRHCADAQIVGIDIGENNAYSSHI